MAPRTLLAVVFAFALTWAPAYGEGDEAAAAPADEIAETEGDSAAADETKQMLDKLTITMVSEVVDERTVLIREASSRSGRQVLRLGNVAPLDKASMSDEEYAEKLEAGKNALKRMLGKQMIWYKAAAPEHQPTPGETADGKVEEIVLGDIWTTEGRHINGLMLKEGHVQTANHYEEELARDILQAESEKAKEQSYKDLEEAIKESEKEKQKVAAAEKAEAKKIAKENEKNEPGEPLGVAGWLGLAVVGVIVVGVATNFGRAKNTKTNPNRKRGPFERFWNKLKGA